MAAQDAVDGALEHHQIARVNMVAHFRVRGRVLVRAVAEELQRPRREPHLVSGDVEVPEPVARDG